MGFFQNNNEKRVTLREFSKKKKSNSGNFHNWLRLGLARKENGLCVKLDCRTNDVILIVGLGYLPAPQNTEIGDKHKHHCEQNRFHPQK